jgi:hypothetical protein
MESIRQRSVLEAVLLETLADYPEGVKIEDAYDSIDRNYTLPEEWSRQIPASSGYDELKNLGYEDWRTVPQELLVSWLQRNPNGKTRSAGHATIFEYSATSTQPLREESGN